MVDHFPLPTLLSHALVAFTIEFDNEAEHQLRYRTTRYGSSGLHAPWLVSMARWRNCMRFVDEKGIPLHELARRARTMTNLAGMLRWGYVVLEPDAADPRPKTPRAAWVVRATPGGRRAREIWEPLVGVIERRWEERFGKMEIDQIRESLREVVARLNPNLPDCLPILHYGLFSRAPDLEPPAAGREGDDASRLALPALLSRVLLAFALEYEGESDLSLAISANVVRVLDERGVRVRDLSLLSGVSKEATSMAMGYLRKRGIVEIEADPAASRGKVARLTAKGFTAQAGYRQLVGRIEEAWQRRFGKVVGSLRERLERLVGETTAERSPLFRGLDPYPDGWRASVRRPQTLPHFPMVLHRGGYPDGS